MPSISIVMPVFNGERYLREAIDSIVAQTYTDWEFIIVNEFGSNETTTLILQEYAEQDSRIVIIQNQQRLGIAASLNVGMDAAQGKYIARMDADDISLPKRLETQAAYLDAHPDIDICGIKPQIFGEVSWDWVVEDKPELLKSTTLFFTPFVHPTIMARSSSLRKQNLKYDASYQYTEDYEFFQRAAHDLAYSNINDVSLFKYRMHSKNASTVGGDLGINLYRGVTERALIQCRLTFSQQEIDMLCIHTFFSTNTVDSALDNLCLLDLLLKKILWSETAQKEYGLDPLFYALHMRWMREWEDFRYKREIISDGRFQAAIERGLFFHKSFYHAPKEAALSDSPKVSILVPTFNSRKYIQDTIFSLLVQTYQNFELLIVNEFGSDDGTVELIEMFHDPRIRIIQNTTRLGLADSLNEGIRQAKGEYIARADADDVYPDYRLERQLAFLEAHPAISLCGSWQRHFGKRDNIHKPVETSAEIKAQLLFVCDICHSTVMLRREDFVKNDLWYDSSYLSEDFELWVRAVRKLNFYNLPEVLGEYRWDGENITASKMDRLEGEAQKIIAGTLKEELGITVPEKDFVLLSGWFNPFQNDNLENRKQLIQREKALLHKIETQNTILKGYEPNALQEVLERRENWAFNNHPIKSIQRMKEQHISVKTVLKKIMKRLFTPFYRPFKRILTDRFDELRQQIWTIDGHLWDYKSEICASVEESCAKELSSFGNQIEELQSTLILLQSTIHKQQQYIFSLQKTTSTLEIALQSHTSDVGVLESRILKSIANLKKDLLISSNTSMDDLKNTMLCSMNEQLQKERESVLQGLDKRVLSLEEQIAQSLDARVSKAEEQITQSLDTRVWNAEKQLTQTLDARVWKAEENLLQSIEKDAFILERIFSQLNQDGFQKNRIHYAAGEKVRILFVFQIASFWPSWESFYIVCKNDPQIDVQLLLLTDEVDEKIQTASARQFLVDNNIAYIEEDEWNLAYDRPHMAVFQTPFDEWHRKRAHWSEAFQAEGVRIVYIPYGIEIGNTPVARKDQFQNRVVINSWRVFTISEFMADAYRKYTPAKVHVSALGLPKFDSFFNIEAYQLPEWMQKKIAGRKICLWKAHFPNHIEIDGKMKIITPDLKEYLSFAEKLDQFPDVFFLFMPHPKFKEMCQWIENAAEIAEKLFHFIEKKENACIFDLDDYRAALVHSDYVMIDRSALMVEAAAMDVPILLMHNAAYEEPFTDAILPLVKSYYHGTLCKDMLEFVENCRKSKDTKREQRQLAFKKCVPFFDGKAGERIKNYLLKSLYEEDTNRKNEDAKV